MMLWEWWPEPRVKRAGRNSCSSTNSRDLMSWITRGEMGSPVSHTDHFDCTWALGMGPADPRAANREAVC